jgi:hypothetical protein
MHAGRTDRAVQNGIPSTATANTRQDYRITGLQDVKGLRAGVRSNRSEFLLSLPGGQGFLAALGITALSKIRDSLAFPAILPVL